MSSDAVEALTQRGIPQDLALRWLATGAVDPDLRDCLHYPAVQGKIRFRHWIQMKHVNNGFLRYTNKKGEYTDHPYLSLEEVEIWHRTGWDPEPAVEEFNHGFRRPWESLYDPAGDGTGQHLRKQRPAEASITERPGANLPARTSENDLSLYAAEIGERMKARGESA
jgi:hypothetical protein